MGEVYPKTYRYGVGWRIFLAIFSLSFFLLGLFVAAGSGQPPQMFTLGLGIACALGFPAMALPGFYMSLTVSSDRLVYRGYIRTITVMKSDIERTSRIRKSWGVVQIDLHLRGKRWPLTIGDFGKYDDAFGDWFDDIPNAEAEAQLKRSDSLLANPAFGSNPTEREYAINRDADWLNKVRWISIAAASWGLFWPQPYALCLGVLTAIPVLAAVAAMVSSGRWTINDDDASGRIGIGGLMAIGPACVLALRAFLDDHMVDWIVPLALGGIAGVVLLLVVALSERRLVWRTAAFGIFAYGLYAWGALLYVDTTFDTGPAKTVAVRVVAIDDGNKTHELTVTPWGSRTENNSVAVSHRLIQAVKVGDKVCVDIYPGLLNFPWYDVRHCPKSAG
jgi:hypothetical protein